jgi:hypothetical protein
MRTEQVNYLYLGFDSEVQYYGYGGGLEIGIIQEELRGIETFDSY